MASEIPWGLYVPEPLLNAVRTLLVEHLAGRVDPDAIGIGLTHLPTPAVNLWPGTPRPEFLVLAGPSRAALALQVTCHDTTLTRTRALADIVRLTLTGTKRGALATPPPVPAGWKVHTVIAQTGHSDTNAVGAEVHEVYEFFYTAPDEEPSWS